MEDNRSLLNQQARIVGAIELE